MAADWGKLHAGDELVVSHLDGPGLVVSPVNTKDELWIPASLIPNSAISRAWSFRPRKIDVTRCHVADSRESATATTPEDKTPAILSSPTSIRAIVGEVVRLSVETHNADNAAVSWRKEGENLCIRENDRYQFQRSAGFVYLQITGCRASDSGIYHCQLKGETGSCSVGISLFVVGMLIKDPDRSAFCATKKLHLIFLNICNNKIKKNFFNKTQYKYKNDILNTLAKYIF